MLARATSIASSQLFRAARWGRWPTTFALAGTARLTSPSSPAAETTPPPAIAGAFVAASARYFGTYGMWWRNRVKFVDFETGFPKESPDGEPWVQAAFTAQKQERLLTLLENRPQVYWRGRPVAQLTTRLIPRAGRGSWGRVDVRGREGGHRKSMRFIDYKRGRKDVPATCLRIEHCPGRTSYIALIQYADGVLSYILAPRTLRAGDRVIASAHADVLPGNNLPLGRMPVGTIVHNIEADPGRGAAFVRAAGAEATVLAHDGFFTTVRMPSTEIRKFASECWASVGQLGNERHHLWFKGRPQVSRWLGKRPIVRGIAKEPPNHHHGGGEGQKHTKRPPVTPWGIVCKDGFRTRSTRPRMHIVRTVMPRRMAMSFGMVNAK